MRQFARIKQEQFRGQPRPEARILCGHESGNCRGVLARAWVSGSSEDFVTIHLEPGFVETPPGSGQWELGTKARRSNAFARRTDPHYSSRRPQFEPRRPQRVLFHGARVVPGKRALLVDQGDPEGRIPLSRVDAAHLDYYGRVTSAGPVFTVQEALAHLLWMTCPVKGCGCESIVALALVRDAYRFPPLQEALNQTLRARAG